MLPWLCDRKLWPVQRMVWRQVCSSVRDNHDPCLFGTISGDHMQATQRENITVILLCIYIIYLHTPMYSHFIKWTYECKMMLSPSVFHSYMQDREHTKHLVFPSFFQRRKSWNLQDDRKIHNSLPIQLPTYTIWRPLIFLCSQSWTQNNPEMEISDWLAAAAGQTHWCWQLIRRHIVWPSSFALSWVSVHCFRKGIQWGVWQQKISWVTF